MRKLRRRLVARSVDPPGVELDDAPPGRIPGATITSWDGPPDIDLAAFFAGSHTGESVAGSRRHSAPPEAKPAPAKKTVCLSDGTEITFAATNQSVTAETV